MRYISTNISPFEKVGTRKEVIKMLKEAGFTAYDFSMFCNQWGVVYNDFLSSDDYLEKAKDLRAYADSIGMVCNQSHAPFSTAIIGDDDYNKKMFDLICRAIEVSGILGVKVCVVHPCNDYTAEENAKLYSRFEEVARKAGVKIGVENMYFLVTTAEMVVMEKCRIVIACGQSGMPAPTIKPLQQKSKW